MNSINRFAVSISVLFFIAACGDQTVCGDSSIGEAPSAHNEPPSAGTGGGGGAEAAAPEQSPHGLSAKVCPVNGDTITLRKPDWESILTLCDGASEGKVGAVEGTRATISYPPSPGSSSAVWWGIVRETHVGSHYVAAFGYGGIDAPTHTGDEGAEAEVVFQGGKWILGAYSGAVRVGPDGTP